MFDEYSGKNILNGFNLLRMEFVIKIFLNKRYLFSVSGRSFYSADAVERVFKKLDKKFTEAEGYTLRFTVRGIESTELPIDDFRLLMKKNKVKPFLESLQFRWGR